MFVEQINQPNSLHDTYQTKMLHFIREIISEKDGIVCNQYTVVTGRPTVIKSIETIIGGTKPIWKVEVCGFKKKTSMNNYAMKFKRYLRKYNNLF